MNDIVLSGVTHSFGSKPALKNLTHTFAGGRVHGVTGPSGCGKTTLLLILLGLLVPDGGTVSGIPPGAASAVFQEDRLCEQASARANVRMAVPGRIKPDMSLFAEIGLTGFEETPARDLSGGMKRRVALLRALAAPFEVLTLDEPFTGLDETAKRRAAEVILRNRRGRTVILVTHSEDDIRALGGSVSLTLPPHQREENAP